VTLLFDPSGTIDTPAQVRQVGYSPLRQSFSWDGAVLASRSLVDVARRGRLDVGDDHWSERANALIAPLMHASALRHESLSELATRIDERNDDGVLDFLASHHHEHHPSVSALRSIASTEERERSSIWSTASGLFAGMRTEAARRAAEHPAIDLDAFFKTPHHLHIVSPSRHQNVAIPLVVGLIDELVHATYDRFAKGARLFLALDELANVAPLPRLASIISEGGGQGVVTLACLQDLSQARSRWGTSADGFVSLFPTGVVLPGIADVSTLRILQDLVGRYYAPTTSTRLDGRKAQVTHGWHERARMSIGQVAQGREGFALALDPRKNVHWITLTPYFRDPRFN
jgi:type IV secretory pathway TraG/TraD family ATPase VirD4